MLSRVLRQLHSSYPQNFVARQPLPGALLLALFSFLFAILYHPPGLHPSQGMGYAQTMAAYTLVMGAATFALVILLRRIPCFADRDGWTLGRELAFNTLLLLCLGLVVYFAAFLIEPPAERWNLPTLMDSVLKAFLAGFLPLFLFTAANLNVLSRPGGFRAHTLHPGDPSAHPGEERIHINSRLKKEKLGFFPGQLLYAEADGNYTVFYLSDGEGVLRKMIRNSISNIEKQLSRHPVFFRTHRAFIVNLAKIESRQGNMAGHRLRIRGVNKDIPVSRQNARAFEQKLEALESGGPFSR
jgi:DNA-binding LytR/AlgR family response regulator